MSNSIIELILNNTYIFITGDWPYYFPEYIQSISIPTLWNNQWPNGLGGNQLLILPLKYYLHIPILFFTRLFGIPWNILQYIFWFFPLFLLTIYSIKKLSCNWLSVLIYTTNSWILLIFSGGQMGIALSYSIMPLVMYYFIKIILSISGKQLEDDHATNLRKIISFVLILALQFIFDYRLAFITLLACSIYLLFHSILYHEAIHKSGKDVLLAVILFGLLCSYWIIPYMFSNSTVITQLGSSYIHSNILSFLSVARFENSFSFLHPNWPENLFGKVYHMRTEFLLLPIIAFSSLLFINLKINNKNTVTKNNNYRSLLFFNQHTNATILFFAFIGLLGAFLAKGVNQPFGGIYEWLFVNMPGFVMFRDPTKFYVLIVLSYSILIPYSLYAFAGWINKKFKIQSEVSKKKIRRLIILSFIIYWLILIRPLWLGELKGIFKPRLIPAEYIALKNYVYSQSNYFRTFWIPERQRFGYFSNTNPAIDSYSLLNITDKEALLNWLFSKKAENQLQRWGVKYIIIPYDSEGELFMKDYQYDDSARNELIASVSAIPWLRRIDQFDENAVFELSDYKDHVWIEGSGIISSWEQVSPVHYKVFITQATLGDRLIFSETYDPGWELRYDDAKVKSKKTEDGLNYFELSAIPREDTAYELYYTPQRYANIGLLLSVITLICVILFLIYAALLNYRRKKRTI